MPEVLTKPHDESCTCGVCSWARSTVKQSMAEYESASETRAGIPEDDCKAMMATNSQPRTFPDVINQWTDELLRLNWEATPEQVALILQLGTLGQRLLYEANTLGMNEALRMATERMSGR